MNNSNKKYYQTFLLLFALLIAYSLQLNATVRYVSKTGLSIPPYTSWLNAADSIQKCINISVFGDTIYVANGVYQEQVVMIPGLSLIGAGMDSCIINTQALVNAIDFTAVEVEDSCLLKGFQIIVYSNSEMGYGITQKGKSKVLENLIINARYGVDVRLTDLNVPRVYKNIIKNVFRGINIFNSSAIVRNNSIYTDLNSQSDLIIGIYTAAFTVDFTPIIDSNYIFGKDYGIYQLIDSSPTIKNNIIIMTRGIGIRTGIGQYINIFNNLITSEFGSDGIDGNGATRIILNNYISGNFLSYGINHIGPGEVVKNNVVTGCAGGISVWNNQNITIKYNNIWNNDVSHTGFILDSTNLSVDPMIVNDDSTQGELDFHLQMYSPLIDAGDPNIMDKNTTRSDIGLYGGPYGESYTYQDLSPRPPKGLFANVDTSFIELTWQKNTEADFNHYNLYRDTTANFQIDSTKLVASVTDTFYLQSVPIGVNRLYFKLTGVDNQGNESNPSEEVAVILVSVKNEWKPVNNYILYQNFPNPFNPSTTISYKLKERAYVKLYVYDVKGELMEVLVNQYQEAGYYQVEFNGDGKTDLIKVKNPFVSGVYLCQIIVHSEKGIPVYSDMIKMILLK